MKYPTLLLTCVVLAATPSSRGQDYASESEEMIVLTPFEVSTEADAGYASGSVLSGGRIDSSLFNPNQGRTPNVPITITKRAESLAVSFSLANFGDKPDKRNGELHGTIEALRAAVDKTPGLRFEHREIRFSSANRGKLSLSRTGAVTSYASILIFADLTPGVDVVKQVKLIRDTVQKAGLQGQTKIVDGVVGLYLKDQARFRREILDRIFEDIEHLKKSVGPDFEILLSGLNQPVRARVSSETDIELWIDYSFSIRSMRELAQAKK